MTWHMANHCPGDAPGAVEPLASKVWYGRMDNRYTDMTNGESWDNPLPDGTSLTKREPDSCRPMDSYSDICYLGTDELIIFVSFL